MRPTKLTVMKGLTVEKPRPSGDRWRKDQITIEVEVNDGEDLEIVKTQLDALLDRWLNSEGGE